MKRLATFGLTLVLSVLLSNTYAGWATYTFKDAGLRCDFPAKPSHEVKKKENSTSHKIKVKDNGTTYVLLVTVANKDVEAAGKSAQDVYDGFAGKYTVSSKSDFTTKRNRKGINSKLSKDNTYINYRSLVVKTHIFQIMAIKSGGFTSDADVSKFFDSFERVEAGDVKVVTKLNENGTWAMRTYGEVHVKAKFPAKPKYTKKEGTKATTHRIQLTTDDGVTYAIVGSKAKTAQDPSKQNTIYSNFADQGQIKSKTFWRMKKLTGIKAKLITKKGAYVHYRVIVVDDTILQAMVIGNGDFAPQAKVDKFFSHLELID
jgi:hypothetical protein